MIVALFGGMATTGLPAVSNTVPSSMDKKVSIGETCGTVTVFSAIAITLMFLISRAVRCNAS